MLSESNCILKMVYALVIHKVNKLRGEPRTGFSKTKCMCAQEAPSAKRSTTVQSRGALLNEVLRYTNAARAATRRAGGCRRTSDWKEKGKIKNQPVSRYLST